jgi:hypothetical protein
LARGYIIIVELKQEESGLLEEQEKKSNDSVKIEIL